MFLVLMAALLAGVIHVVTGPDHLVAIAPMVVQRPRRAAALGAAWGLGHAGGTVLVGLAALALREVLPLERISALSDRIVAVVLIAIGVWGIRRALRRRQGAEERGHGHGYEHGHGAEGERSAPRLLAAALPIGVLHAVAGASHLLGIVPAVVLPDRRLALAYLLAFGLSSIVAMVAWSTALGWAARRLDSRRAAASHWLLAGTSTAALAVGCVWLVA